MGRPAKSLATQSAHLTNKERAIRQKTEENLRGNSDKLEPPEHLTEPQRCIFNRVVEEMKESETLGNLDSYLLGVYAVDMERVQAIDAEVNEKPELMKDNKLMATRERYIKGFLRCAAELGLSPQSRAKMAAITANSLKNKADPLLELLQRNTQEEEESVDE